MDMAPLRGSVSLTASTWAAGTLNRNSKLSKNAYHCAGTSFLELEQFNPAAG